MVKDEMTKLILKHIPKIPKSLTQQYNSLCCVWCKKKITVNTYSIYLTRLVKSFVFKGPVAFTAFILHSR